MEACRTLVQGLRRQEGSALQAAAAGLFSSHRGVLGGGAPPAALAALLSSPFLHGYLQENAKLMGQLADLRTAVATQEVQSSINVLKLSYRIIFVGASTVYGITNFMIPYIKENWKNEIVGAVIDEIHQWEKKRALEEAEKRTKKKWGFLGY